MRSHIVVALVSLAFLYLCLPSSSYPQSSARTLSRSLDQLIDESDSIVHGSVASSKIEPHPQLRNLMTVLVTLNVKETYKGKSRKSLVFRQYIWNTEGGKNAAEYSKGQDMVLLLRPVSEYGLTSPAGLEQGRFHISLDRNRHITAVNGRGNVGLFDHLEENARARGIPLSAHLRTVLHQQHKGPLLLTDLQQAIRTFARSR